jgi:hypothetical protein
VHNILTKRWQWLMLMLVVPVSAGVTVGAFYLLWTVNPRAFDDGTLVLVALGLTLAFHLASIMGVVSLLVRRVPKRTIVVLWILGTLLVMALSGPSINVSTRGGGHYPLGHVVGLALLIYSFFAI